MLKQSQSRENHGHRLLHAPRSLPIGIRSLISAGTATRILANTRDSRRARSFSNNISQSNWSWSVAEEQVIESNEDQP